MYTVCIYVHMPVSLSLSLYIYIYATAVGGNKSAGEIKGKPGCTLLRKLQLVPGNLQFCSFAGKLFPSRV